MACEYSLPVEWESLEKIKETVFLCFFSRMGTIKYVLGKQVKILMWKGYSEPEELVAS